MVKGMKSTYKSGKVKCRPFTDGSKVCMSNKAWSVFFATVNKMGAKSESPRPQKKINESKIIEWFMESKIEGDLPRWVNMALGIIGSDKFDVNVKAYWKAKLNSYCKSHPKSKICKSIEINESLEAMHLTKELLARIAEEAIKK